MTPDTPESPDAPDALRLPDLPEAGPGEVGVPAPLIPVAPEGITPDVGLSAPSGAVAALLEETLNEAGAGAWDSVAERLRGALEDHPDDPYVLCWLGMAERELGLEGVSHERFRRALEQEPRDPVLLATAGNALAQVDDPAAEGALRTAALLGPAVAQARWMYGAWLAREGMFEEALAELGVARELDPEDAVIHTETGVALALAGRLEEAASSFGTAAELDPEDGWILILLGLTWLELEDTEAAARELVAGADLREGDGEALLLAALALAALGEEDQAFVFLERARFFTDEGADRQLLMEVEERLEGGTEPSTRFLRGTMAPLAFRERLMQRP
jgi:Flp pilus assembly protein TadD